jgi:NAD-dependent deacetylase
VSLRRTLGELRRMAATAQPNPAHRLFAALHARGVLHTLITQNIDGLHAAAGVPPDALLELHGAVRNVHCLICHQAAPHADADELYDAGEAGHDPRCPCGGPLAPAAVPFGGALDVALLRRAREAAEGCDVMLVLGTGLLVAPANTVPTAALQAGAQLVIVNVGETKLDERAHVRIEGRCGVVCDQVLHRLHGGPAAS